MIKAIIGWFSSALGGGKGVVLKILLLGAGKAIAKDIMDVENQKKALEFVKELRARTDLTGAEKAKLFNRKFLKWAAAGGKAIASSVVNCLREMAVVAVKTETPDAEDKAPAEEAPAREAAAEDAEPAAKRGRKSENKPESGRKTRGKKAPASGKKAPGRPRKASRRVRRA